MKRMDLWISLLHVCFCIGFLITFPLLTPLIDLLVLTSFIVLNLGIIYMDLHSPTSMVISKTRQLMHVLETTDLHHPPFGGNGPLGTSFRRGGPCRVYVSI
ncbi:hypothetical protein HMI56_004271 [Coelomomyces lativittatus]|nr:hypothetical protein HMI56_004271 [Coelomomyces lativittatus]